MKKNCTTKKESPLKQKGFKSALDVFFEQNVPQLGGHITREAVVLEIIKLVEKYHPKTDRLKMGQMIWFSIHKDETAGYGKKLSSCRQQPVIIDVIHDTDIEDLLQGVKKKVRQQKVAVRLFKQAYEQDGVLTLSDVGSIMRLSTGTISNYIRAYEKENDELVPRRGTIHDMGRSITHKKIICQKFFYEKKTIEITAKETYHSPQAVVRYINDFKRVRECLKAGWSITQTAYTTGLSKSLTNEYVDMMDEHGIPVF